MRAPLLLACGLLGCTAAKPPAGDDTAPVTTDTDTTPTDPTFTETLPPDALHILAAGSPAQGDLGHPLTELSVDLETRWFLDLPEYDGTAGTARQPNGDTVYVRSSLPPDYASALERVDADGNLLWSHDEFFFGDFAFAHGLAETPDGDFLIADTVMARVIAVTEDGELLWELPFTGSTTRLPNGLDLQTGTDGVTRIVVSELFRTGPETSDRVEVFQLGGRTDVPTLEWTFTGGEGSSERLWPHGPRFLEDGAVLVNFAARGQIARLEAGVVDTVVPEVPGVLAFPRDTLVLPDGTWLVADAGAEVVRIFDPLGSFQVVDAVAVPGVFGLARVDCAADGGLPCLQ